MLGENVMIWKLMRVVFGMAAFTSLSVIASQGSGESDGMHAHATKRYVVIRDQSFRVIGPDGSLSAARYVLDKRDGGMLSCFTRAPAFVAATAPVVARLKAREGRFMCFEGREPLEQLALAKRLIRSNAPLHAGKLVEDEDEDEDWGQAEQNDLEADFWDGYADAADDVDPAAGSGGPRCMRDCGVALTAALRFCAAAPPPLSTLCVLGAGGLYVVCIASC